MDNVIASDASKMISAVEGIEKQRETDMDEIRFAFQEDTPPPPVDSGKNAADESVAEVMIDDVGEAALPDPNSFGISIDPTFLKPPEEETAPPPPPSPPSAPPPSRHRPGHTGTRSKGGKARAGGRKKSAKDELRRQVGVKGELFRLYERAKNFVLYSGAVNKNSPVIVAIRLFLLVAPIIFSIAMSYWAMSVMFPRYEKLTGDVKNIAAGKATLSLGSRTVNIPMPEGYTVVSDEEFLAKVPLAEAALKEDKSIVVMAGLREDPENNCVYYVNVSLDSLAGDKTLSEGQFKSHKKQIRQLLEVRGSIQMGVNQIIEPDAEGDKFLQYGRTMGTSEFADPPNTYLFQKTSLVWQNKKAFILNSGFYHLSGGKGDRSTVQSTLTDWRTKLLE